MAANVTVGIIDLLGSQARAWESSEWVSYFNRNSESLLEIPWQLGADLTHDEARAIAKSVRTFQLGESSEGRQLRLAADEWAVASCDPDYPAAMRLFIMEEQRHSRELGRFLELNGIPLMRKSWVDSLFRGVRHLAGLELSIMTLLTAELVAQVYYVALREAAGSVVLKRICDQIVADEAEHVRFQCERLAIIGRKHSWARLTLRFTVQRAMMAAALPIVWATNRRAYLAGGYSFGRFVSETCLAFYRAAPCMHPRSYI